MRPWIACPLALLLLPAAARATNYPYVQDGPVITGVSDTEAWVTWYTAHHEGTGTECTLENDTPLLGDHNTDIPTLTLGTGPQITDTNCDRTHKVHLTGLLPSTAYSFTLDKPWDAKGGTTAAGSFTTAPPASSGAAVKFVVYGDTRNDLTVAGSTRTEHQAVVDAILAHEGDSAFLVHTGDMALNLTLVSGDDKGYTEFFAVERQLLATRPVFVVLGNHETIDTAFFDAMFDPPRFENIQHPYYYSIDWGTAHLVLADSFEGTPTTLGLAGRNPGVSAAQVQWMDADLQAARAAARTSFLAVHQGPYSYPAAGSGGHGGLVDVVINLVPLMLKYGVLASFGGHDHYYQRGHEGCIDYMVVGGGGAPMYAPDSSAAGVIVSQQKSSYMVVSVLADGSASMQVKDTSGTVIDTFTFVTPDPACPGSGGSDGGTADAGAADAGADAGAVDAGADAGGAGGDGGSADAGSSADAGTGGTADAGNGGADAGGGGPPLATINGGCNCTSGGGSLLEALGLLLALGLRRRRPRR